MAKEAEGLLRELFASLVKQNYIFNNEVALPNPYIDINKLLNYYFVEEHDFKQYKGRSYILDSIVGMIVRRGNKQTLENNWRKVSHIEYNKFIPEKKFEYFNFHNNKGTNYSNFPKQEQSYKELQKRYNEKNGDKLFVKYKEIIPFFSLVYPHRFSEEINRFLDLNKK